MVAAISGKERELYLQERERRIELAKNFRCTIEAIDQVEADMPFWRRRIIRAMKNGRSYSTNAYSERGSTSVFYMAELGARLNEMVGRDVFEVQYAWGTGFFGQQIQLVHVSWDVDA